MTYWYDNTLTADQAAKTLTNVELARFHNHNDNGIRAEWRELGDRLIAFGRGYLAYGDNGYLSGELDKLSHFDRKRVGTIELNVVIKMIRDTIERGNAFLAENNA